MSDGNMAIVCMNSRCKRFRVICYGKTWHHCRACEGPMKRARPADRLQPLPPDEDAAQPLTEEDFDGACDICGEWNLIGSGHHVGEPCPEAT